MDIPFVTGDVAGKHPGFDGQSRHPRQFGGVIHLNAIGVASVELQFPGPQSPPRLNRACPESSRRWRDWRTGRWHSCANHRADRTRVRPWPDRPRPRGPWRPAASVEHIPLIALAGIVFARVSGHGNPPLRRANSASSDGTHLRTPVSSETFVSTPCGRSGNRSKKFRFLIAWEPRPNGGLCAPPDSSCRVSGPVGRECVKAGPCYPPRIRCPRVRLRSKDPELTGRGGRSRCRRYRACRRRPGPGWPCCRR